MLTVFVGTEQGNAHTISMLNDSYEIKNKFENAQTIFIVKPKVIKGDREHLGDLLPETDARYKIVTDGLYLSAQSSLEKKGYRIYTMEDLPSDFSKLDQLRLQLSSVWSEIMKFSDAGKPNKRKILPFRIANSIDSFGLPSSPDLLFLVQCYGKFDFEITSAEEMTGVAAEAAISGVATGVISIGYGGFLFSPEYSNLDYKISAVDVKTGELVWYREGNQGDTDIRSRGKLSRSFDEIINELIPQAIHPVTAASKFKIKRSEIL